MNGLSNGSALTVKGPSATKHRANTKPVSDDFPPWLIKTLDRHPHLKPKLQVIALSGWKAADVHGWRASFVVCSYQDHAADFTAEATVKAPALDTLKRWVDAFYMAKVTT